VKDPDLEAYVLAIESYLSRCRGREHVLTPPEFELAGRWFAARVPLTTVLAGVDAALAARSQVSSLALCRPFVEKLARAE
jgi:hypothetical protein